MEANRKQVSQFSYMEKRKKIGRKGVYGVTIHNNYRSFEYIIESHNAYK